MFKQTELERRAFQYDFGAPVTAAVSINETTNPFR